MNPYTFFQENPLTLIIPFLAILLCLKAKGFFKAEEQDDDILATISIAALKQ